MHFVDKPIRDSFIDRGQDSQIRPTNKNRPKQRTILSMSKDPAPIHCFASHLSSSRSTNSSPSLVSLRHFPQLSSISWTKLNAVGRSFGWGINIFPTISLICSLNPRSFIREICQLYSYKRGGGKPVIMQ